MVGRVAGGAFLGYTDLDDLPGLEWEVLENLSQQGRVSKICEAYKWFGKVGSIVRGISPGLDKQDQGLDDASRTVLEQPVGPVYDRRGTLIY